MVRRASTFTIRTGDCASTGAHTASKFDAVYLNDKYYGHTGEFNNCGQALMVPPGEYTVRIDPVAGGSPFTKKIQIEAGKTVVVP